MSEDADALARDLIWEVGRWPALGYVAGEIICASNWRAARQGVRLLVVILRCG